MTTKAAAADTLNTIDAMLARIGGQQKTAEANTEAGGYQGETTHPVANVDDRTDDAQEGERSSENTSDVKEDQGTPAVDNTAPGTPGGQDSVQHNIGTNQSATGEDSAVETDSAKGGKEDSGYDGPSSHPARTDNDALDGQKYSSAQTVLNLIKTAQDKGNELLAKIAVEADGDLKKRAEEINKAKEAGEGAAKLPPETVDDSDTDASNPPPGKGKAKDASEKAAGSCGGCNQDPCTCGKEAAAKEAGAAAADAAAEQPSEEKLAEAQNAMVVQAIEETIATAYGMAEKTAEYLYAFGAEQAKMAMEGEGEPINPPNPEGESGGGESSGNGEEAGAPEAGGNPFAGGGEEEAPPIDEETLLALLAGEGGGLGGGGMEGGLGGGMEGGLGGEPVPGAEEAMGAMGGMPPGAEGGMPPGAEGGMPPGAEGGMPPGAEGGMGPEEQQMLLEALAQAGVSPEAFEAKAASKHASAMKNKSQVPVSGKWKPKTAEQAQQFQQVLNYVQEIAS